MDKPPTTPSWFPKNRLWLGLERYGVAGAAAVIEARIQGLGGTSHQETLEEGAARQARALMRSTPCLMAAVSDSISRQNASTPAYEFKAASLSALNFKDSVEGFLPICTCKLFLLLRIKKRFHSLAQWVVKLSGDALILSEK
jgi:hypothetical protein